MNKKLAAGALAGFFLLLAALAFSPEQAIGLLDSLMQALGGVE
ncbi:MAG: hypothetical protein ACE5KF_07065 [Kiloniellaceae bacterium]